MLHVTSVDEERDSRAEFPRVATVLIPNGVEVPSILPSRQWRPEGVLRVVFLGRLDPKKGIENLIHGVTQVTGVDLDVAIYGIGVPEYERSLKDLVGHLSLGRKISFKGHVEHEAKSEVFMHADIVVVPSFTENFALVVAEALAHAVPVIASKGTPWQDIEKHGCGLWVGNSPEAIADAIENMSGRDLAAMGRRGREWMLRDFSWAGVAESMKATYATFVPQ
jgi:glycosyltransferase involved in cell wall biosynthesis